ncbi:hypothetical protein AS593_19715 [Caulobacter vibrioides]|nr:hypothetical protein AS593_19715 [Caulobacter vibrioides]
MAVVPLSSSRADRGLAPYRYEPGKSGPSPLVRLGADAMRLKLKAMSSIRAAGEMVAPAVLAGLPARDLLPPDAVDTLWMLFFQNAQVFVGHARSQTPVVAFFNPLLDLWWVTLWSPTGRRAEQAKLIAGGAMVPGRPATTDPLPAWRRRMARISIVDALRGSGGAGDVEFGKIFAFESATPPAAFDRLSAAPGALLVERGLGPAAAVQAFSRARQGYPSYGTMVGALSSGAPPAGGLSAEARRSFAELAKMAPALRARLSPVSVARIEGLWFVVSCTPFSGRYVVLSAHRETPGGGEVARLTLVDLFGGAVL